jgi:hypothetical protein
MDDASCETAIGAVEMAASALFATGGEAENFRRRHRSGKSQQLTGYGHGIIEIRNVGRLRRSAAHTQNYRVSHVRLRAGTH